jgi:hypothetical protein
MKDEQEEATFGHAREFVAIPRMSLRDWFAGQALVRLCKIAEEHGYAVAARESYAMADAMLKTREKKEQQP